MSHAMSYPVTLKFGIPHGVACGFTLPALWDHVAATCPGSLEEIVTALGWQNVKDGGRELRGLLGRLGVPRILAETGMTADAALALVPSMFPEDRAGNQWPVCSVEEVRAILRASL